MIELLLFSHLLKILQFHIHYTVTSQEPNLCPSLSITTTDHTGNLSPMPLLSLSHHYTHFYYSLSEIKTEILECVLMVWCSYRVPWRLVIWFQSLYEGTLKHTHTSHTHAIHTYHGDFKPALPYLTMKVA